MAKVVPLRSRLRQQAERHLVRLAYESPAVLHALQNDLPVPVGPQVQAEINRLRTWEIVEEDIRLGYRCSECRRLHDDCACQ